ncbi:outer membrane lipoprotein SlyB [Plasticicumulans lactativorans]|uniref:Outer membrane lipoprotein SlyB n=1 Tax=Plasticicumulans lactativorans TaxID=1133106 RepID=A0A4R2L786_9GAMM|nr:glycine zipper 2TM domain-containing protein [Plasticicumulans lactativorans]TCO82433.1 outer membrane lipoprotein SlyB [Plasticicumulans lactativorans]
MKRSLALALCTALAAPLAGCVPPNYGGANYAGYQARQLQQVQYGVVESAREVQIDDARYYGGGGVGTLGGAALGGIAGSAIGQGRGSAAAAIGGAIIGGLIGNAIDNQAARQRGVEVTVRLDNGRVVAITQGLDEVFNAGERVRVLTSADGQARVTR